MSILRRIVLKQASVVVNAWHSQDENNKYGTAAEFVIKLQYSKIYWFDVEIICTLSTKYI